MWLPRRAIGGSAPPRAVHGYTRTGGLRRCRPGLVLPGANRPDARRFRQGLSQVGQDLRSRGCGERASPASVDPRHARRRSWGPAAATVGSAGARRSPSTQWESTQGERYAARTQDQTDRSRAPSTGPGGPPRSQESRLRRVPQARRPPPADPYPHGPGGHPRPCRCGGGGGIRDRRRHAGQRRRRGLGDAGRDLRRGSDRERRHQQLRPGRQGVREPQHLAAADGRRPQPGRHLGCLLPQRLRGRRRVGLRGRPSPDDHRCDQLRRGVQRQAQRWRDLQAGPHPGRRDGALRAGRQPHLQADGGLLLAPGLGLRLGRRLRLRPRLHPGGRLVQGAVGHLHPLHRSHRRDRSLRRGCLQLQLAARHRRHRQRHL